jgi:hypothetical protein
MLPVAPLTTNTLTTPARRLPLGMDTAAPAGPTLWRAWIPTFYGGEFRVTHTAATSIEIRKPTGEVLAKGTRDVAHKFALGQFGEVFVAVDGGAGVLTATLTQTYWSRKKPDLTADPLLPWNFFYWPASSGDTFANKALWVMRRYAWAIGSDPAAAEDFEKTTHQIPGAAGWAGHCHNAAPASALFEQPQTTTLTHTAHAGVAFDQEEMEFLGTEYCGSFAMFGTAWVLGIGYPLKPWDLLGYLKPGGPKTEAALADALDMQFGASAGDDAQRAAVKEQTKQLAATIVSNAGGADPFASWMQLAFGVNGAMFLTALQACLAGFGVPLISNMRSYYGASGPEQVWNQAFFYYQMTFVETPDWGDERCMQLECNVYSNIDHYPSTGLPGTVNAAKEVTPGTSSRDCQRYAHTFRIGFDRTGSVNVADQRNEWRGIQNDSGEQLYPPTELNYLIRPSATPITSRSGYGRGNPVVGTELLQFLSINERFR